MGDKRRKKTRRRGKTNARWHSQAPRRVVPLGRSLGVCLKASATMAGDSALRAHQLADCLGDNWTP